MLQIPRKEPKEHRDNSCTGQNGLAITSSRDTFAECCEEAVDTPSKFSLLESDEVRARMSRINREVEQYLSSDKGEPSILYEAAHHLVAAGGKRLRSLITLLCCEAVGGDGEKALSIGLATELLQTASLIHDDIIDEGETRRGIVTVHRKFGRDVAILAGDLLILQAIRLLGEHATPGVVARIGLAGVRVAEGEATDLQITARHPETLNAQQYFEMIARKTAAFMKEAAAIGALIGNATQKQEQALSRYGELLGYAFQLRDDILDIEGSSNTARKTTRADLRLKRGNYLLVRTKEVSTKREWIRCLDALEDGNLDVAVAIIRKTALAHAYELARSYVAEAKQALQGYGFCTQDLLEVVADFAITRTS